MEGNIKKLKWCAAHESKAFLNLLVCDYCNDTFVASTAIEGTPPAWASGL